MVVIVWESAVNSVVWSGDVQNRDLTHPFYSESKGKKPYELRRIWRIGGRRERGI